MQQELKDVVMVDLLMGCYFDEIEQMMHGFFSLYWRHMMLTFLV
ncbi:hypothetical protein [Dictyobacter vulcani]|nr:hypothetical protein [Dictyobacter vulcani]